MFRYAFIVALLCSTAQAQMVAIDWPNRTVGEQVVSVKENPVRLTPEQLAASGHTLRTGPNGKTYWAKSVMSGCDSGACDETSQRPLQLSGGS